MVVFLRALFVVVLASMIAVTSWASLHTSLFQIPREVVGHPWFIATLFDAYWGFLTFFVWVAWKEQSWAARALWFIAILALGNIAMAAYMLRELFHARAARGLEAIFGERSSGRLILPGALVGLSAVVYLSA